MSKAISCRHLVKSYENNGTKTDAVRGLNLEIERGECFGLLGPNGAGKTTTVEILEGLREPTSGEVEILGARWGLGNDDSLRQRLGVTLQETKLIEKLSVIETLRLFRSFYSQGISPEEVIKLVGLEEKSRAWIRNLSGGQRQRVAVACALVGKPDLLFLDEPTTGLDPQARRQVWDIVTNLKRQGRTIILTTHYMDEAERLCDRVAVIDLGKIIALGSPKELIAEFGGDHVIEFTLEAKGSSRVDASLLSQLDDVRNAVVESNRYLLAVSEPHRAIPSLLELLRSESLELKSLTTRHVNLEDVFVSLTGKHLRNE